MRGRPHGGKAAKARLCAACFFPGGAGPVERAGRHNFAAKEAFLKAAGTGLGGFALTDLTVLRKESGAPYFALTGPAAEWTAANALTSHLSLTHENGLACAFVILEQNK